MYKRQAHKLGLKVAAHAESPEGVKIALENGVDTIEHGAKPDDEMIELFKKTGASLVATLSPALPYALFDRSVSNITDVEQHNGKIVFDGIIECAKACLENGIPVGLGTDTGCPYVTHYDICLLYTSQPYNWSDSTIANILENETYLGNTVNMKLDVYKRQLQAGVKNGFP